MKVASEALNLTEKADRRKVEHTLGVLASREKRLNNVFGRTKGWVKVTKRFLLQDSFAERIIAKRFRETGSWFGLAGDTIHEKALSFIRARVRSIAFIKSGWIPAIRILSSRVYKKPRGVSRAGGAQQIGKPKGTARPATFSLRSKITAEIVNSALLAGEGKTPAPGGNPMPIAEKGLQMALAAAAKDMLNELARRLDPDFRAVSKR